MLKQNIEKYYSKGIIIDTNLLILLLVGIYDINFINKFKVAQKYFKEDYNILYNFIHNFNTIFITPHILTELSNLSMKMNDNEFKKYITYFIEILKESKEINIEKNNILSHKSITKLGVTDIGIMIASENNGYLFITDDFPLANISESKGLPVINFNHLREYNWFHWKI